MDEEEEGGDEAPGDSAGRVLGWAPAPCLRPQGQRHLGASRPLLCSSLPCALLAPRCGSAPAALQP